MTMRDPAVSDTPIRDAASVILLRTGAEPAVLMGQRGAKAAFMPSKYVFPGGAVDPEDASGEPVNLAVKCAERLRGEPRGDGCTADALARAALRELAEETGLHLRGGASDLRYVFRAITPPGRPRRFDARFFLAPASQIIGDPENFDDACDELSHLHWVALDQTRQLDLPFITEVVLAQVAEWANQTGAWDCPQTVPFFDNSAGQPRFLQIA